MSIELNQKWIVRMFSVSFDSWETFRKVQIYSLISIFPFVPEFGVFVNSFGSHSRPKPLMWSRLPLAFGEFDDIIWKMLHYYSPSISAIETAHYFILMYYGLEIHAHMEHQKAA